MQPLSIPERFLRQIWIHGDLQTAGLKTIDGKPVTILSAGAVNPDAGPDFLDALVKIGNVTYRGDVELHQTLGEWRQHAHHVDPKYNRVILHVVLEADPQHIPSLTTAKRSVPALILARYLRGPLNDVWHKMILDERSERLDHIKCFNVNDHVPGHVIDRWLHKLALERMELKVRRFEERLKTLVEEERLRVEEPVTKYGKIPFGLNPEELPPPVVSFSPKDFTKVHLWTQILYEGVMEALGFSKNRTPFLRLARSVRLNNIRNAVESLPDDDPVHTAEAFLFGAAGMLEFGIVDAESKQYLRQLRQLWKKIQSTYRGGVLHPADWQFFRLRPENFPTVRLAGAARIALKMAKKDFFKSVITMLKEDNPDPQETVNILQSQFVVQAEGFWKTRYRFEGKSKTKLSRLIGRSRADDIILNVVLPVAFLYARVFKQRDIRNRALHITKHFPPLSDNTVTRTMERELIKGKILLRSAFAQQGTLQLYKYYCVEERCAECEVGKVVFKT